MSERAPDPLLERMLFFSDAVFAIAITLLIIEVHVPELPLGSPARQYWQELAYLLPAFAGYALSFLVIARFWITHHAAFAHAPPFDAKLLWPNIHLLMAVAFMPFSTAFLTRNIGGFVPSLVYNLTLVVASLLSVRVVRLATSLGDATGYHGAKELAFLRTRGLAIMFAGLLALALGLVVPVISQAALGTTPMWLKLLRRRAAAQRPADSQRVEIVSSD
ncbi:MAG: TMEM175 family protein [Steroidobacteraceae bacterium]